ncbi:MAG: WG repeat-containing protein [Lewinellaceae bacterium]|nr:WG repeat-containing protein [Lewinellaceae bacterium]
MKIANSLSLLFALYSLTVAAQSPDRTDLAIFFPVTEYSNGWQSLPGTKPELDSIAKDVRDLYGFYTEVHPNKSKRQIKEQLAELAIRRYGPQDQLLLFFSMHGNFDEAGDAGCLVPYGGRYTDPTFDSWLLHTELRALVARIPCEHILLVLDACYSGTFSGQKSKPETAVWENKPDCKTKVEQALNRKTRLYLTAGGKEKVPAASDFVKKWRSALGSGGGEDGILSFAELFTLLSEAYPSPRSGSFTGHLGGDFVFVTKTGCAGQAREKSADPPPVPGNVAQPLSIRETAATWKAFFDERGRKGFKDQDGRIVVQPRFIGDSDDFSDGLSAVWFENNMGFIDTTGKIVLLDDNYTMIVSEYYSDGLRPIVGNGIKFVDKSNRVVLQTPYYEVDDFSEGLVTAYQNDRQGVIDKKGNVVIPFEYENVNEFVNGLAEVRLNGKWGVIDRNGKVIIPFIHSSIQHIYKSRVILACRDGKMAMFDEQGNNLTQYIYTVNPRFGFVPVGDNYEEDLFPVQFKDKWGYIDRYGNEAIPFIFDAAKAFDDGLAQVNQNRMVIDKSGHAVLELTGSAHYHRMGKFFVLKTDDTGENTGTGWSSQYTRDKVMAVFDRSGNAVFKPAPGLTYYHTANRNLWLLVEKNRQFGVADPGGKVTISAEFDSITNISHWFRINSFFYVWKNGKTGVAHIDGKIVIPAAYDDIVQSSRTNIYAAQTGGKWVFINIDGTRPMMSINRYDSVEVSVSEFSMLGFREGKWCFLDANLIESTPPKFQKIYPFVSGRTWALLEGKWGITDLKGHEITGFIFEEIVEPDKFDGWWCAAKKNGKWGYIDITDGKTMIDFVYDELSDSPDFDENIVAVKKNGKWGGINRKGEAIIKFIYTEDFYFLHGKADVTDMQGRTYVIDRNGTCIENCPK